ncbi:MAG: FHA domain-containing protein [Candidatus Nanopelagicales bacterium]
MAAAGSPPELVVLMAGSNSRFAADRCVIIGREAACDVVVPGDGVSRRHLQVALEGTHWVARDLGSTNGLFADGTRVDLAVVSRPCVIQLGTDGPTVRLEPTSAGTPVPSPGDARTDPVMPDPIGSAPRDSDDATPTPGGEIRVTIGRGQGNSLEMADLLVSRRHAVLTLAGGTATITDLNSANGTFVNGRRISSSALAPGDRVGLGNESFTFDGMSLTRRVEEANPGFSAHGIGVRVGGRVLLHDVSFALQGRSLMAIVGPSGAGKSTLLGALTGQRPANTGTVVFADRDLNAEYDDLRSRIGLVPQSDLLHTSLTTRRALEFGAELRFPADTTPEERRGRVDEVMSELGLSERADVRIDNLSGGQRKRTSVAIELLTKPALLFLDEPTSGLDPGLDQQVMTLLRRMADEDRIVVVVTHSVANLDACDLVMVLAEGGYVAYLGPPTSALDYFGARAWSDVFVTLTGTPGLEWHQRFLSSPEGVRTGATQAVPRELPKAPVPLEPIMSQARRAQLSTLSRRAVAVIASDRGLLRILVLMPLILAALGYAVADASGLGPTVGPSGPLGNPQARSLLMVFLLGAVFIGTAAAIQEIAKERTIYARERAIGLSLAAYLGSKVLVVGVITAAQGATFVLLALAGRPGPPDPILLANGKLEIVLLVVGLTVVSMTVGLAVSAFARSMEMAMPALVVITMIQVVLSGAVPIGVELLQNLVGWVVPAYWAMGALAGTADLNVLAGIPPQEQRWNWAPELGIWLLNASAMSLFGAIALGLAVLGLRRAEPSRR